MTTPFTYQRDGVRAIHRFKGRAILSDDVGLGKTFQALLYASRHADAWPIVVVCPASLKVNWQREAAVHLGVRAEVLEGMRPPPRGFDRETSRIIIINYDILKPWLPHLKALRPGLVIFDESHMLAGRGTLRTRCSRALARKCERVLCLTATPVVNRPADLWPSLNIVRPDLFPSFVPFAQRWCAPKRTPWGFDYRGASKDVHVLNEQLQDNLLIRRTKADVSLQLPRKRRIILPIPIKDRKQYEQALTDFAGWLRENAPGKMSSALRAKTLVQMGYLRRLAADLKLPAVCEWVDNFLEQGDDKLIVFAVHRKIIDQLMERYGGTAVKVDGSITGRKRQGAVDQFLNSPRTRLFVGNVQAAGAGWSAKGVSAQAIIELAWSPGLHTQAEGRIHGLGRGDKGKVATSFYLVGERTYEETHLDLLQKKNRTINSIVDGKGRGESFDVFDELMKTMRGDRP